MISRIVRDNLLAIAAAYRDATGQSLSRVSKHFYSNSPNFFKDLKAGKRSISVRRLEEMVEQFRAEWPKGAAWPFVRPITMGRRAQD